MPANMSTNMPTNMSINNDPLVEESTKGFGIIHSYPFINDGLKFNVEQDCTLVPNAKTSKQESNAEIKPAWKPVKLDEKPPYSYATLIAHAILSSEEKKMTLYEIYQWISDHYPCYSMKDHRWQNSIRHNLSLQKAFVKLERNSSGTTPSGKGCYWTILPGYEQQFIDNLIKRGMGRSSNSSSRSGQTASYKQCRKFMADSNSSKNAPLFTIFRMNPTHITKKKKSRPNHQYNKKCDDSGSDCDSDCDSAVDLGCDSIQYPVEQLPLSHQESHLPPQLISLPLPPAVPSPPPSQLQLQLQLQQPQQQQLQSQQQEYLNLLESSFFDMSYLDEMFQPLDTQVSSWLNLQQEWQPLPQDPYLNYNVPIYNTSENSFMFH